MPDLTLPREEEKTKHTPGPWIVGFGDGSGPEHVRAVDKSVAKLRWGCSCCERRVENEPLTTEEHANARLIAAAPDLLEAARGVDVLYAELHAAMPALAANPDQTAYNIVQEAVTRARAAIAKARA